MTVFENENGTLSDMSLENENGTLSDMSLGDENGLPSDMGEENDAFCGGGNAGESEPSEEQDDRSTDGDIGMIGREEYERLIKTTFKDFFAEDTQRLINKRFKKYKVLEEKVRLLETEAEKYADVERLILEERERAVSETEERMNRQFIAMRSRGVENAVTKKSQRHSPDVASLTKSERAHLATRALMGEKIKL